MSLGLYITRWRHHKGFGVHSPFAFSLIADIAGKPGSYYGDDRLREQIGNRHGTMRRQAWLLHRLIARIDPTAVIIPKEMPEAFTIAATIARTDRAPISEIPKPMPRDFMIVASPDYLRENADKVIEALSHSGNTLVVFGRRRIADDLLVRMRKSMPGGWALIDSKTAVLISSTQSHYMEYQVRL